MTSYRFRTMRVDDVEVAADLLALSFEERLRPFLPYCQPGLADYLRVLQTWPQAYPTHHWYLAVTGDDVAVGFAELRATAGTSLLSYLCVAPEHRGQRIAERLLTTHLRQQPDAVTIELDVFAHNDPALRMYERLGFKPVTQSRWWVRDLPESEPSTPLSLAVPDWHAALASLERYGFCQASAVHRGRGVTLKFPSRSVVRILTQQDFRDDELLADLRSLGTHMQKALLVCGEDDGRPAVGFELLESRRLRAVATDVLAAAG